MLICCDEQQSSSLQTWKAEFFMMDDIKALRAGRLSRQIAERHHRGWFAIVRDSRLNRPFRPRSFSPQCAGCLVLLPNPTLRLLSQRTSALGHISCTQQSSRAACGFGTAMFILPTPTSTRWPVCGYPAHIWPKGTVASEKGYLM